MANTMSRKVQVKVTCKGGLRIVSTPANASIGGQDDFTLRVIVDEEGMVQECAVRTQQGFWAEVSLGTKVPKMARAIEQMLDAGEDWFGGYC